MSNENEKPKQQLSVDLAARAEARLEVKTEVPAAAAGRLIDALTDIIRPFSERRGLKADLLRLQREDVAIEIARLARERVAVEGGSTRPVANKILVPLIEKGSCEDIDDTAMIDKWANLLASAAVGDRVPPRFIGILGELSGSQAKCLEYIAFKNFEMYQFPYVMFADSSFDFGEFWGGKGDFMRLVRETLGSRAKIDDTIDALIDWLDGPGCYLDTVTVRVDPGNDFWSAPDATDPNRPDSTDLNVLESLGLVRRVMLEVSHKFKRGKPGSADVFIVYYHLSELGVEFCEICSRPTIGRLGAIDDEARKTGKQRESRTSRKGRS